MLGDNIVRIRKARGFSLDDCAKEIGISPELLSEIENNIKRNPSIEILVRIADTLKISTSQLLTTEEKLELALNSLHENNQNVNQYYKDTLI